MKRYALLACAFSLSLSAAAVAQPADPTAPPADSPAPAPEPLPEPGPPPAPGPEYPAYGEPPPPPPPQQGYGSVEEAYEPPPPATRRAGGRTHDGLYFRFGLGGGSLAADLTSDALPDTTVSGGGAAVHLMLGGTPGGGFVIGGGLFGFGATEPEVDIDGTSSFTAEDTTMTLSLVALFVDWFPDPAGGFHVGLGLGPAALQVTSDRGNDSDASTGFGATLFAGYDFWVAEQWALGGMLSLTGANTEIEEGGVTEEASSRAITLHFTALHH